MSWKQWLSERRWPAMVVGLLAMSIGAQGVLVYFATRPDAPKPIAAYYEKAQAWDEDRAARDASRELGWAVAVDVPSGDPWVPGMPRPVDVTVRDRAGLPVTGLAGDLVAMRPSDGRLDSRTALVELPQAPGRYRALVHLDAPGLWEFGLDAARAGTHFVHRARVSVAAADVGAK